MLLNIHLNSLFHKLGVFVTAAKEVMFSSLFVCLFVCLSGTLRKNIQTDLHEIFREGWQWANGEND